jgi:glycine cleavage system regulatory protein
MTILGEDKPGLVEAIANLVAQHGGNWLESRMARMGGQFAGILRVEVRADKEPLLVNELRNLQARGLTVVVHSDARGTEVPGETLCSLEIVGQDRPGIVREISRALARRGVNVEELNTECASAAMSGESMFTARAKVKLPLSCSVAELRQDLEKIGEDLIVEVSLRELSAPAAG